MNTIKEQGKIIVKETHFSYEDGTTFYPFGTTIYALAYQNEELIEETFATLEKSPFNKVRMCVFPKYYDYNKEEPQYFPFEKTDGKWDMKKPCEEFWHCLETYIKRLGTLGIQCDLILFHSYDKWGFSSLTREEALEYLEYVVKRLSPLPNLWWSLANEYDLMAYNQEDWECFAEFIHKQDAYGHLLSNHHMIHPWDFSNPYTTHICLQTNQLEELSALIKKYKKPLIVDECGYEGNIPMHWGNLSGFEMVHRFWTVCMQGGYCSHGETFANENDILWWSKGGKLVGESPKRIGFLREILESLPGPLTFSGMDYTEEEFEGMKTMIPEEQKQIPFMRLLLRVPWDEARALMNLAREQAGNYKDEAYMVYYGKHCTTSGKLNLPVENKYDVEVINVWEMTRERVLESVNGEVEVSLPGKEGMAVLALKK